MAKQKDHLPPPSPFCNLNYAYAARLLSSFRLKYACAPLPLGLNPTFTMSSQMRTRSFTPAGTNYQQLSFLKYTHSIPTPRPKPCACVSPAVPSGASPPRPPPSHQTTNTVDSPRIRRGNCTKPFYIGDLSIRGI